MKAYKGFDKDLKCRGFQYEVGKTYTHEGEVKVCSSGFHACTNPIDVWSYYGPDSRFAIVEAEGAIDTHDEDSKIAAAILTVVKEISLAELIAEINRYYSTLAASGSSSKLAASGDYSNLAASGDYSNLAASGDNSICMAAGTGSKGKVGRNGALALSWYDGKRYRISTAYEGENGIKADIWYALDENGNFIEADE